MPPVPVLVPTPAPVRLNQSLERERARDSRPAAVPNVTYWLVPFSCRPELGAVTASALASFDAPDALLDVSTAVTT